METVIEQIIQEPGENEVAGNGTKRRNPGLRALMAIKNFTGTLEKDYTELLRIEGDLDELNKKGLVMLETAATPGAIAGWMMNLQEVNNAIRGINENLTAAKEKIEQKVKSGYPELWKQLVVHITALNDNSRNAATTGFDLLPEDGRMKWEKEFTEVVISLTQNIVSHVESCRILLQMIERYSPDELNSITKIIVDQIPADFTYEEAVEYQHDYYKALINFKREFKQEKNLWDKFLDILAGGTHQSPSEGVMMERWLDGEKGDL